MKSKLITAFLIFFVLTGCNNDDTTISPVDFPVGGKFYKLTSLILNEAVDVNNDGTYSFDLMEEINCGYNLYFENDKSNNPAATGIDIYVNDDENGNMEQQHSCSAVFAVFPFLFTKRQHCLFLLRWRNMGVCKIHCRTVFRQQVT